MKLIALPGADSKNQDWGLRMTDRTRAVVIRQLPEELDGKQSRLFFHELEVCMRDERPRIVLDCSQMQEMDQYVLHLLLCCLEAAIKRNGDVRLAAVTPVAMMDLERTGLDRLFRIFGTVEEAVKSFERRVTHAYSHTTRTASANAA